MKNFQKKEKLRLTTKDGESLDEMIEKGQIEQALAFIEVELVHIDNEMKYLRKKINKVKAILESR